VDEKKRERMWEGKESGEERERDLGLLGGMMIDDGREGWLGAVLEVTEKYEMKK
jgi:hypothetical protein